MSLHVLGKRGMILLYWAAQAAFVGLAMLALAHQADTVNGPAGRPLGSAGLSKVLELVEAWEFWGVYAIAVCVLMVLQCVLVWPVRRPRYRAEKGWSLRLSIGLAALVGTTLAAAIVLAIGTLMVVMEPRVPGGVMASLEGVMWVWLGGSYIGGAVLMHRFCVRGLRAGVRHETLLGRIAATLFVGTLVEAVAIMPIDVMFRRKNDCYCFAGTFLAYALLLAAGLVTLGPAILLPALSRRRKRWYASRCDCCGYDMRGALSAERVIDRCPECGAGWKCEPRARPRDAAD